MTTTTTPTVTRLPVLVTLPAVHLAGPQRRFDQATKAQIPQLWPTLLQALPFAGQVDSRATYGVVHGVDGAAGSFLYMAGVAVRPGGVPPAGFDTLELPAATYLVIRITLDGSALHAQITRAMGHIWGELVPASGLDVAAGPQFELYDSTFDPMTPGARIDFHIPVQG